MRPLLRLAVLLVVLGCLVTCGGSTPGAITPAAPPPSATAGLAAEASPAPASSGPAAPAPVAPAQPSAAAPEPPARPRRSAAHFVSAEEKTITAATFAPAASTRHAGCKMRGALPDAACTPGAVMTTDLDIICHESTRNRRHVSPAVHKEAFTDYGYGFPQARGAFEVDHLIPLELGGDNTIDNLWAQPASPKPGFHEKDHVEDYLHKQVCSGAMSLAEAQKVIATNWLSVWKTMNGGGDDGEDEQ